MAHPKPDQATRQDLVEEAFCEYLQRVDAGETIDRAAFISRYPEVADTLAENLDADSIVRHMAGPTFADATSRGESGATIAWNINRQMIDSGESDCRVNPDQAERPVTPVTEVTGQDTHFTSMSGDTHPSRDSKSGDMPAQFGRYRVEKLLGQGAMGAVYLAHDTQLDRRVALKIPKFEHGADAEMLERFYREARAVATLHHPNICPVYDVGEIDGRTFLSMAYIQGRPLSNYTKSEKRQGERSAAKLVMKLARALQEAHEIGVIHRDLKPANIMVNSKGEPVVMDFGLARRLDSNEVRMTISGMIVGTPAYMSPEQVEGVAVGPASDQYSLGVILYELLAGRLPFEGTVLSVIGQIAHTQPLEISQLRSNLDPRLAAICGRMMAKDPGRRFENMAAAAEAINKYLVESKDVAATAVDQPAETSLWDVIPEGEAIARDKAQHRFGPTVAEKESAPPYHPRRWPLWTALGAGALLAVLTAVVVLLQTPEGTVRIEITDPQTQVEFAGQSFTFDDDGAQVEVTPGKHTLSVKRGSLSFTTDEFLVEKNGEAAVKVSWLDGELLAKLDGVTIGRDRNVTEPVNSKPGRDELTLVHRFEGHRGSGALAALDVSADGRWMISAGGDDGTARLWDLESKTSVLTLDGPKSAIRSVAISPDGKRGAGLSFRGEVAIWDLDTGKVMHSMSHHARGDIIAFSPSGRRLITMFDDGVGVVWDVQTGVERTRHDFGEAAYSYVFRNDDQALLGTEPPSIWDIESGKVETKWASFGGNCRAISTDGSTLATIRWDHAIRTWNMDKDPPIPIRRFSGHTQIAGTVRFLPNQRYLISGGTDGRIILWDRETSREVARQEGQGHLANAVLPLPDGRHAVSFGARFDGEQPNPVQGDYAIRMWRLPESVWPDTAAETPTPVPESPRPN